MQMLFVIFMCSTSPGTADGAQLCAASEGTAENLHSDVDRVGPNPVVYTVCTPTKQCMFP